MFDIVYKRGIEENMKCVQVEKLQGGEILEKDILTEDFQIILSAGAVIKKEYISKLKDLRIKQVYIKPEELSLEAISLLKSETEEIYKTKLKDILEKHIYQHNEELVELCNTAEGIMNTLLSEEKVVEQVYDIKERNADIYEHSISVCTLATLVGLRMKLDQERILEMGIGCLLHDIGLRYLTVPYDNHPVEKMSDIEQAEYKKHPVYGYTALKEEDWISSTSKNIILCHHEHIDGSGYPLHAVSLSVESRIVCACNIFDEMISGIGCKRTKVYEAIEYLKAYTNIWYDKEVIRVMLQFLAMYPVGSKVVTDDGSIAVVISQNKSFTERPTIKILSDKDGNPVEENLIYNLMEMRNIIIVSVLD